jgi:hypothetical protein
LVTFTLSGYYDASLRQAIDTAPRKATATTTWFSAHQTFPDAFFGFNRTGRMDWQVSPDFLALQGTLGALRNVAVLLPPSAKRPELGRVMCSYAVEFEVRPGGEVHPLTILPQVTMTTVGLRLEAQLDTPAGAVVTWDFGDGTGIQESSSLPHTYAKPGRYDVTMRIALNGRLTEYHAAVVVSRQHPVLTPLVVVPIWQAPIESGKLKFRPSPQVPSGESPSVTWRIDGVVTDSDPGPVTFTLDIPSASEGPKRHVLRFVAVRELTGRFYSQQRYLPAVSLPLKGLHLATNRTFDPATDAETTASLNTFGQHVFGPGTLSPTDRWTLELPFNVNPCAVSVSATDVQQYDLGELADAFLALEYQVRDE